MILQVTATRHTVSLPEPVSVKFNDHPSELTAGLNFDLRFSVTGVSATTKCVIGFPTSDYHLKKSVASCDIVNGTNTIRCDANKGEVRSLPVHVNSAAKAGKTLAQKNSILFFLLKKSLLFNLLVPPRIGRHYRKLRHRPAHFQRLHDRIDPEERIPCAQRDQENQLGLERVSAAGQRLEPRTVGRRGHRLHR